MTQTLIITGASAGIGKATAAYFIEKSWNVVNLSRRKCPVAGVQSIQVDLSRPGFLADIQAELESAVSGEDRICLVHNAAWLNKDSLQNLSGDVFREIQEINIIAPQVLNQFLHAFMKPGSSILYIGSTLSEKAVPGAYSYVVSKHAIIGMMRATCQDLAGRSIHTAAICPGFTDTEMLNNHLNHDQEILNAVKSMSAYNRLIKPEEIAEMLFFSASNPIINGAVLHGNLGQVER